MSDERDMDPAGRTRDQEELARRRAGARRTALFLGAVVLAIFIAFLVTGVTGRG